MNTQPLDCSSLSISLLLLSMVLILLAVRFVILVRKRDQPSNVRRDLEFWGQVGIAMILVPVAALGILLTIRNFA